MARLDLTDPELRPRGSWPARGSALLLVLLAACAQAPSRGTADPPSTDSGSAAGQGSRASSSTDPRATASPAPVSSTGGGWSQQLGQVITVTGTARNLKLGAVVHCAAGDLWIDGLDGWPGELSNQAVRVTGKLIARSDLPVFEERKPTEPQVSGMPVPPGTDLAQARQRYLLTEASWRPLK